MCAVYCRVARRKERTDGWCCSSVVLAAAVLAAAVQPCTALTAFSLADTEPAQLSAGEARTKQQERQSNGLSSLNSRYSLISIAFERYCLAIFHSGRR